MTRKLALIAEGLILVTASAVILAFAHKAWFLPCLAVLVIIAGLALIMSGINGRRGEQ